MTDRICAIALREKAYLWWWVAFVPSMALTLLLVVAIGYLFYAGIGIWGVNWPVMWGFAILSYVWWIAIASGGTIISALFFLVRADWRDSINRIAESMMLFGAAAAGHLSDPALGASVVFLLAFFLSEHHDALGAISKPAALGFLGAPDLCSGLGPLLVFRADPGSCERAGSGDDPVEAAYLWRARLRLSGHGPAVEAHARGLWRDGRHHGAGGRVDPQYRGTRLRRCRDARVALDRISPVLCLRRVALGLCHRAAARHSFAAAAYTSRI